MNSFWEVILAFPSPSCIWEAAVKSEGQGSHMLDASRGKTSAPPNPILSQKDQKSPWGFWGQQKEPCWLQRTLCINSHCTASCPALPCPTLYSQHPKWSHLSTFVHTPPLHPAPAFPAKMTLLSVPHPQGPALPSLAHGAPSALLPPHFP